ncbi:hypothetical protein [Psychrobacillus sp. NPDC096623]|uniref:hypothetical protein n=1 Tax=Psychrobacillus sp. NPDC096623 TaxID=3364492 RepID=UPI0037FECEC9
MTKNKKILVCLVIAFIFGVPFNWIRYKGQEMVSIFQVFDLGIHNMLFDVSILVFNTFIIFIVWSGILKFKNKKIV